MKFSVVICTYNYGHLLPDALRSVAAQTASGFEVLVVDDGSSDNTEAVVERFSRTFPRCVYLKKPHTGLADTRNVGVRAASGTHIAFLDADDLWAPDYLQTHQAAFAADPAAEIAYSNGLRVSSDGRVLSALFPNHLPPVCGTLPQARDWFPYFFYVTPSALVFAKSLYDRIGPFDTRFPVSGEDWDWVLRAVISGAFCIRRRRNSVLYRVHGANMTTQQGAFFEAWLSICETTLLPHAKDEGVRRTVRNFARQWLARLLAQYRPATGRVLVSEARRVFPADKLLKAVYLSTYLGSTSLLKLARFLIRGGKRVTQSSRLVDFTAPPDVLFASLPGSQADKVGPEAGR